MLHPDTLRSLRQKMASGLPVKILFVCLGNICRSPAAEGIMRQAVDEAHLSDKIIVDSAGTAGYHVGQLPDQRMRIHARRRGLELDHRCRRVSESDFSHFDLIIGMDHSNLADLRRIAPSPEAEAKIAAMADFFTPGEHSDHVPDPYYEGAEGFELVLDLLGESCQNLLTALRQ